MSTISCTEFQRLLDEAVESDGDVTASSLSEHAAACTECRAHWQRHCVLERAVTMWRAEVPVVDLVDTIVARNAFDQPTRAKETQPVASRTDKFERTPQRQAWGSVAVAAATLLLGSLTLFNASFTHRDRQVASSTLAGKEPNAVAVTDSNDAELETLVEDAGTAYWTLASQAAEAVAEVSRAVTPTRLALLPIEESESETTQPAGWGNDLKPIGRDFGQALDFLFDAIPSENSST